MFEKRGQTCFFVTNKFVLIVVINKLRKWFTLKMRANLLFGKNEKMAFRKNDSKPT